MTTMLKTRNVRGRLCAVAAIVLACGALIVHLGCRGADYGGVASGILSLGKATQISKKDERSLGQTVAIEVTSEYGLHPDPTGQLTTYVTMVGLTVASCSNDPTYHYIFGILNTDEVNAIDGPGGAVMITWGALQYCHDESELAGVLSHEISHICNHDGLHAFQQASELQAEGQIWQSATAGNRQGSLLARLGVPALKKVVSTPYLQAQEKAADIGAVDIMTKAGYDPHAFLRYLQRMQTLQQENTPNIFATHPGMSDRIETVSEEIAKLGDPKGAVLATRFTQWTGISNPGS